MKQRFASIWFQHLLADRMVLRQPELKDQAFVLARAIQGRLVVMTASPKARSWGASPGMSVADAKAIIPDLQVLDDRPGLAQKLLEALGAWCLRFTPLVSWDVPDGLMLDIQGCTHLWNGEKAYVKELIQSLAQLGFQTRVAVADTMGLAWALARFGHQTPIMVHDESKQVLAPLPPESLRLDQKIVDRLYKLGLRTVGSFMDMPEQALSKRFGTRMVNRLRQALGKDLEHFQALRPEEAYIEQLPCFEPVRTATAIEQIIESLLERLCNRLRGEGKGVRSLRLICHRMDGDIQQIGINPSRPSVHVEHLKRLMTEKITDIAPGLGIELFVLEAPLVEKLYPEQERMWREGKDTWHQEEFSELIDRLKNRQGVRVVHKFLPQTYHWPEQSFREALSLEEKPESEWVLERPRPILLLTRPVAVEVTAPIPDYPPVLFRYKGKTHQIKKADGPERIERAWWMDEGELRDYYYLEDEQGRRYWVFRSGHFQDAYARQWYLHGFFP